MGTTCTTAGIRQSGLLFESRCSAEGISFLAFGVPDAWSRKVRSPPRSQLQLGTCLREHKKEWHLIPTILVVILVLVLVGALPRWSHSRSWGYAPAGGFGLIFLII